MRLDLKTLTPETGNIDLSKEIIEMVEWLGTTRGREAVIDAVQKSQSAAEELNKVRRVEKDQLNTPITL